MKGPLHIAQGLGLVLCLVATCVPAVARAASSELMRFDITWVGISVGTMTVQEASDEDGRIVRSFRLWNRPWIAAFYPVDTTLDCVIEPTPKGLRHVVTKKVLEKDFRQDDVLVLYPDEGTAVWSNALKKTVYTSTVPKGSRDLVSFFFDLRDAAVDGRLQASGDYQLVMDGSIHALELSTGPAKRIRTRFGRMEAIPVNAVSKSPSLFSRNRPRAVWVATSKPVVLFADVDSRFGTVRATLTKWELDGKAVEWSKPAPKRAEP